jgi:hypothetical protein
MRIRLNDTREECEAYVAALRTAFEVLYVTPFKPWTRDDPDSKLGAVYVTLELPRDAPIRATAERIPELPADTRRRQLRR